MGSLPTLSRFSGAMLKLLYHFIAGNTASYPFEHRVFNLTSFIIFLFSVQATFFNYYLGLHYITLWLGLFGMIASLGVFYLSRVKHAFSPRLIGIYSLISILILSPLYFYNGGAEGPVLFLLIMLLFIYILIAPVSLQGWVYATFSAAMLVIFFLEYHYPEWVIPYESREQRFIDFSVVIVYITFFTSFVIWIFRKSYDGEQRTIKSQKEELERLYLESNEKNQYIESLMKELHHRVKNNLQVISSLISLQSNRMKDEEARQALEEGRTRINAMALIHQKLYMDNELAAVNMKEYLEHLSGSLAESFGYPSTVVSTDVQPAGQTLDIDRAVSIGLIVNELVTNAFKHAFQGVTNPGVFVLLHQLPDAMQLEITDNGNGINQEKISNNSFGMKLVHTLVQQLGATITIETIGGTSFRINI